MTPTLFFSNNAPLTFKCSSSPLDRRWLISMFVGLWVRVVGGICDILNQRNDLPLQIFKKMWRRNKQRKSCMQMQHRSEFFGLCFLILSWITAWIQNAKGFVYVLHVKVASVLGQQFFLSARPVPTTCGRALLMFVYLARRVALAKKHTHEECKECHEVNVMASQWNCGGGSVLWAEPGPWALPSSLSV